MKKTAQKITMTKITTMLLFILCIGIFAGGCGCSRNRNKVIHREVITDTIKNYILALETGDKEKAVALIISGQRDIFERNLEEATRDDMISSAIDFVERAYSLQELDEKLAIFWSEPQKEYLVLSLENKNWLINPEITDEMNK